MNWVFYWLLGASLNATLVLMHMDAQERSIKRVAVIGSSLLLWPVFLPVVLFFTLSRVAES